MNESYQKSVLRLSAPLFFVVAIFILFGSSIQSGFLLDGQGYVFGRDFLNVWHYGISAFSEDPAKFYETATYNTHLDRLVGGIDYPDQQFSYPPHLMVLAAPFGLLPYNFAIFIFTTFGLGLLWKTAVNDLPKAGQKVLLWSPALIFAILCGQFTLLLVALFFTVMTQMDKRPILTACLIALLTVKPQIGFLFPVFFLATGRYRVFIYTSIAVLALFAASLLWHGIGVWEVYLTSGISNQAELMVASNWFILSLMPTLFVNLAQLGVPVGLAQIIHGLAAIIAIIAMVITIRKFRDVRHQFAVFTAASIVVTPYLMVYDTLLLIWAVLLLAGTMPFDKPMKISMLGLVALPVLGVCMSLFDLTGYGIIPWAAFICVLRLIWAFEKPQPLRRHEARLR